MIYGVKEGGSSSGDKTPIAFGSDDGRSGAEIEFLTKKSEGDALRQFEVSSEENRCQPLRELGGDEGMGTRRTEMELELTTSEVDGGN